jgi:hypothetical protein
MTDMQKILFLVTIAFLGLLLLSPASVYQAQSSGHVAAVAVSSADRVFTAEIRHQLTPDRSLGHSATTYVAMTSDCQTIEQACIRSCAQMFSNNPTQLKGCDQSCFEEYLRCSA